MIEKRNEENGGKKMNKCIECGKNIKFFQAYRHPTMGGNNYVCNECFDRVTESVAQWREFIISNSFSNKSDSYDIKEKYQQIMSKVSGLKNKLRFDRPVKTSKF